MINTRTNHVMTTYALEVICICHVGMVEIQCRNVLLSICFSSKVQWFHVDSFRLAM